MGCSQNSGFISGTELARLPDGRELRIKNCGKQGGIVKEMKTESFVVNNHLMNTGQMDPLFERSFFIKDERLPLDEQIVNLIYDPSFNIQTNSELLSRHSERKFNQHFEKIYKSMQHVGERLGCAKSVLKEMVDDLKKTKWTPPPKDAVEKKPKLTQTIVEQEEEGLRAETSLGHVIDTTISSASGLTKIHNGDQQFQQEEEEENVKQVEDQLEELPYFEDLLKKEGGVEHPFLLLQVRSGEIESRAIEAGCFVRDHPYVHIEARIMANQQECLGKVDSATTGARSMACPHWAQHFQIDFPNVDRAELTLRLFKGNKKEIGEGQTFIVKQLRDSKILKRKVHFYEQRKFYQKQVLAHIKVNLQLILSKTQVLLSHFENCKLRIIDILKAKDKIKDFEANNRSFVELVNISDASNVSQVVRFIIGKKVNDISMLTNQELNRFQSPSVLSSRGSFQSERALSRQNSAQRLRSDSGRMSQDDNN